MLFKFLNNDAFQNSFITFEFKYYLTIGYDAEVAILKFF